MKFVMPSIKHKSTRPTMSNLMAGLGLKLLRYLAATAGHFGSMFLGLSSSCNQC